jgi:hypothetical protein
MVDYEAMYSFYSYTDIWSTEPDASDPDHIHVAPKLEKRNMCSGTVAWALFSGGGFSMWPWYYADSVRNPAASVMYRSIYDAIGTKSDSTVSKAFIGGLVVGGPFAGAVGAIVASSINSSVKDRMANQFVNCMAFNDCYNTASRWKSGVGAGNSLSPDNLVPVGFTNLNGKQWGMSGWNPQDTKSLYYDSVEGISYTGGYWKKY